MFLVYIATWCQQLVFQRTKLGSTGYCFLEIIWAIHDYGPKFEIKVSNYVS